MSEHQEQCIIFKWAELNRKAHPTLKLMYGTLNGVFVGLKYARKLKRAGLIAGVPDIVLPVARGGFHGLYIELKVDKNKPSETQKEFIKMLIAEGYEAVVVWGSKDAINKIKSYLSQKKTRVI